MSEGEKLSTGGPSEGQEWMQYTSDQYFKSKKLFDETGKKKYKKEMKFWLNAAIAHGAIGAHCWAVPGDDVPMNDTYEHRKWKAQLYLEFHKKRGTVPKPR